MDVSSPTYNIIFGIASFLLCSMVDGSDEHQKYRFTFSSYGYSTSPHKFYIWATVMGVIILVAIVCCICCCKAKQKKSTCSTNDQNCSIHTAQHHTANTQPAPHNVPANQLNCHQTPMFTILPDSTLPHMYPGVMSSFDSNLPKPPAYDTINTDHSPPAYKDIKKTVLAAANEKPPPY